MRCPRCEHENRVAAKFCEECASPMPRICSNCGVAIVETSKFCSECGAAVAIPIASSERFASPQSYTPRHLIARMVTSRSALEGERKQVTVLFADVKGSMEL